MVYFAYNHIAFVTLLAFAAVNAGESMNVNEIRRKLHESEYIIPKVILSMKGAEKELHKLKDKILSHYAGLQGEIEKHINCLETAYKYKWGETVFHRIISRLETETGLGDTINCIEQEFSAYQKKTKEYPLNKCFENPPAMKQEDLDQLDEYINQLFTLNHWYGVHSSEFIFSV
ncbi:unnamed protein product [Trichobilharzia szidati]|nr:unnamed protein product [Trichobilharzia szidati]